ncbi:MAG: amidohydrolase [Alphaproteobacteria bacterium]|nr:MAG: amidohydrolase [Alphaproteobacteria bacterium]
MLLAGFAAATVSLSAAQAETLKFTLLQSNENVGHLTGEIDGNTVKVDYFVDQNGRGPKHAETLRLNKDGIPLFWSVDGTSLMGGPVAEQYEWKNGTATWHSQADDGAVKAAAPGIYIVNDGSPWSLDVYARALLSDADRSIDVLPAGRIRLEELQKLKIKGQADGTVYRLSGINMAPDYIALAADGHLFAKFSGTSVVVREGFEGMEAELLKLGAKLESERAEALQTRLAHRFDGPVRIRNVRVFDPKSGELGVPSTVVMMDGRITGVLPLGSEGDYSADQTVIDGEGGTLVPGLHDMHSHTTLTSGLYYLAAGVTSTRDMGNSNSFLLDLMSKIETGDLAGPRITPAGFMEGRSPYSENRGFVPETPEKAVEAVNWYADHGYWQIKIYNSMNPDWVPAIAEAAHKRGLTVTGHVPAFSTANRSIEDGYSEITHINQLMLGWLLSPEEDTRTPLRLTAMARAAKLDLNTEPVKHTIDLMRKNHIAHDPTAVILERLMLSRAGAVPPGDVDYLEHMPIGYQRYRKRSFVKLADQAADDAYRGGFQRILDTLALLHKNGIRLLPGTDDTTGFTVHRELELYTLAGLSPAEALRLGTLGCAEYLGNDKDLGSIERGKRSDFFLVPGDPTKDIRAIKTVRMVVRGDTVYFPTEIYDALSIEPFTTAPTVTAATAERGTQ